MFLTWWREEWSVINHDGERNEGLSTKGSDNAEERSIIICGFTWFQSSTIYYLYLFSLTFYHITLDFIKYIPLSTFTVNTQITNFRGSSNSLLTVIQLICPMSRSRVYYFNEIQHFPQNTNTTTP